MKKYRFLCLILILVLSACGSKIDEPIRVETEDQTESTNEAVAEEKVQTEKVIMRIFTNSEAPTNYLENEELVGTSVDIVNEMIKLSGEDIVIKLLPWSRAFDMAVNEPNIMLFTAGKTEERENLGFHFIGPVATRKQSILALKESKIKISEIEDLKDYVVGGMNGDWRLKYVEDRGVTVDPVDNHEQNYKKLATGRLDMVITSDLESLALAKVAELESDDLEVVWLIKEAPSYIIISNGTSPEEVETQGVTQGVRVEIDYSYCIPL